MELFKKAFAGIQDKLVDEIAVESGLWIKLEAKKVLSGRQMTCQMKQPKDTQIEKLVELLQRRDDCLFDPFCEALIESENGGVVERYLQTYRHISINQRW